MLNRIITVLQCNQKHKALQSLLQFHKQVDRWSVLGAGPGRRPLPPKHVAVSVAVKLWVPFAARRLAKFHGQTTGGGRSDQNVVFTNIYGAIPVKINLLAVVAGENCET